MERIYRRIMDPGGLIRFRTVVGETDLWVAAQTDLRELVADRAKFYRRQLQAYLQRDPEFAASLRPKEPLPGAPPLVVQMALAGRAADVGPMAAVAGAIAQAIGEDLRGHTWELIIENGGDIYLRSTVARTVALYAGPSELSGCIGLTLPSCPAGMGVCTSAGTTGPSLSLGRADAATVVAADTALADAAATGLGNRARTAGDLEAAVAWATRIPGVIGALAVIGPRMAAAGALQLVPIEPAAVQLTDETET